jgi:hypothetical protein
VRIPNSERDSHQLAPANHIVVLKYNDIFGLARSLHLYSAWLDGRAHETKGSYTMTTIFTPGRETATALAAAFITALLFVSSAASLLPIA